VEQEIGSGSARLLPNFQMRQYSSRRTAIVVFVASDSEGAARVARAAYGDAAPRRIRYDSWRRCSARTHLVFVGMTSGEGFIYV